MRMHTKQSDPERRENPYKLYTFFRVPRSVFEHEPDIDITNREEIENALLASARRIGKGAKIIDKGVSDSFSAAVKYAGRISKYRPAGVVFCGDEYIYSVSIDPPLLEAKA
jgi:hypothetical protein